MKKIISVVLEILLLMCPIAALGAESEAMRIISDNNIIELPEIDAETDKPLSIMIFSGELSDNQEWQSDAYSERMKYFAVEENNSTGKYKPIFFLPQQGKYTAFFSTATEEVGKMYFIYADKTTNETATNDIKNIIEQKQGAEILMDAVDDNNESLAFISDCYKEEDSFASQLIYNYLCSLESIDYNTIYDTLCKAYTVSALKDGRIKSIEDCSYTAKISGTDYEKFFDKNNASSNAILTQSIIGVTDLKNYDMALKQSEVIGLIAYSGNTSLIKEALIEFKNDINISISKITDSLVRDVNGKKFKDFAELKNYINSFTDKKPAGSGATGGGGGGGYVSNNTSSAAGNMSGMTFGNNTVANENNTESIFKDIEGVPWAKEAIETLFYKGIISGRSTDEFVPNDNVLREEFVKMIVQAFRLNTTGEDMKFEDVREDDWYYPYVSKAFYSGVVNGESQEYFGAGRNISRQDMASILYNACNVCGIKLPENIEKIDFYDSKDIADYALPAVENLQKADVISGNEGLFNPHEYATRAESAKVIHKIMDYIQEPY